MLLPFWILVCILLSERLHLHRFPAAQVRWQWQTKATHSTVVAAAANPNICTAAKRISMTHKVLIPHEWSKIEWNNEIIPAKRRLSRGKVEPDPGQVKTFLVHRPRSELRVAVYG